MKYILDSEQMKSVDKYNIDNFCASIDLMEEAGRKCFEVIKKYINRDNKIVVFAGSGGNGGDGLVIARYLKENNYDVSVFHFGNHFSKENLENKSRFAGFFIKNIEEIKDFKKLIIVDALLGNGQKELLNDEYKSLIRFMNSLNGFKISIDLNSGINSSSGKILGEYFASDLTIAINNFKTGHFFNEGISAYKKLEKIDINLKYFDEGDYSKTLEAEDLKEFFSQRNRNSNKGDYGRVALIGGSRFTPGAIEISLNALLSLRSGVGYSMVCVPESLYDLYVLRNPENIYSTIKDDNGRIIFDKETLDKLIKYDAIAFGMGCGISEDIYKTIKYLFDNFEGNLLLDADALNSISKYGVEILNNHKCNVILTPHLKEFERLSNIKVEEIKKDYIKAAKDFAKKYNLIINLKNDISVISDGKEVYLNINGNAGLAKGGSGDLLSGLTLGLINKKNNLCKRVAGAAFILGRSAEIKTKEINEYSLLARDVSSSIIEVINEIIKK